MFSRIAGPRTAPILRVCKAQKTTASTAGFDALKQRMSEIIPKAQKDLKEFRTNFGDVKLGDVTIDQAYGGMRGIKCLVTETSLLDAEEGIRYRGHTLFDLQKNLPKGKYGDEPMPEGALWLLMTGEMPTQEQCQLLSKELANRADLPQHVVNMLDGFPAELHPMAQFSAAVAALNSESNFAKAYSKGVHKSTYWESTLEDAIELIAKLPVVAAKIYRNVFKDSRIGVIDPEREMSENFANMLGFTDKNFVDLLRLYLVIHADHEGGNVSAHTTHLVGSALSDPYLAYSAGLAGLAGPLHGLANQEVLVWLNMLKEKLGDKEINSENISAIVEETLTAGLVVPGYGHAVLRKTDPRYTCQREFALKHLSDSNDFKLVSEIYKVVPDILLKYGKAKNPWPNVDAHSGILLRHYGMTEMNFYTVLFGVSRALGCMSSLVWDRAFGLPIERPKSMTTESLKKIAASASKK